jgi:hypothetical protein
LSDEPSDVVYVDELMADLSIDTSTPLEDEAYFAAKTDYGKSRMDLLPFDALKAVGDVLAYGAKLYGDNSWQTVPDGESRYTAALLRHLTCAQDAKFDIESGLSHRAHMACNALFLLALELRKEKLCR